MITSQITTHIPKIVHMIHLYQQTFDLGCGHIYIWANLIIQGKWFFWMGFGTNLHIADHMVINLFRQIIFRLLCEKAFMIGGVKIFMVVYCLLIIKSYGAGHWIWSFKSIKVLPLNCELRYRILCFVSHLNMCRWCWFALVYCYCLWSIDSLCFDFIFIQLKTFLFNIQYAHGSSSNSHDMQSRICYNLINLMKILHSHSLC